MIANTGLKRIVYLEPYGDEVARVKKSAASIGIKMLQGALKS